MPGKKRNKAKLEQDAVRAAQMYSQGMTQKEIADALGVDKATVYRDLQRVDPLWREGQSDFIHAAKLDELARLDRLETAAWVAFEDSKQSLKSTYHGGMGRIADGKISVTSNQPVQFGVKEQGQNGDPRYLAVVEKCIERRCAILGLDAPKKIAPTDPSGEQPYVLRVDDMATLLRLIREHKQSEEREGEAHATLRLP